MICELIWFEIWIMEISFAFLRFTIAICLERLEVWCLKNWDLVTGIWFQICLQLMHECVPVQTLCEPCFPPHYNIVNRYIAMYHSNISLHVTISCHVYNQPGMLLTFLVIIRNIIIRQLSASVVHDFLILLGFKLPIHLRVITLLPASILMAVFFQVNLN